MATNNSLSLAGLNKAAVLAALYNAAKPQGMGFMHYDPTPMTADQAQKILGSGMTNFDYLKGRVMKIDLSGDTVNTFGYNRDNGEGAAERAVNEMRSGNVNSLQIQETHRVNTSQSVAETRKHLNEKNWREGNVFHLGTAEFKDVLGPKLNRATGHSNQ